MRALVTGGSGQLGRALSRQGPRMDCDVIAADVEHLDIRDANAVTAFLLESRPDVVINAAAYTAVDKAETERELAFAVNADGPANLARACSLRGVPLLHVSTDYVFDGTATTPYVEDSPLGPMGVYGQSKAAGESAVTAAGGTVVRTSWLFEERGPSFVHTMLRLARERPTLRVVSDQVGCPTWADDLARGLFQLAAAPTTRAQHSTYHYCNDGVTSWHGFAVAIIDEARKHGPLACERIDAITTAEYPTPARRPAYSVLDTTRIRSAGIVPPHWSVGLAHVVAEVLR